MRGCGEGVATPALPLLPAQQRLALESKSSRDSDGPGGGKRKQASLSPAVPLLEFCQWLWAVPPMISPSPWNQASNLYQIGIVHPRITCAYT